MALDAEVELFGHRHDDRGDVVEQFERLRGSISDLLNLKKTFSLIFTEHPSNSALRSGQPSSS